MPKNVPRNQKQNIALLILPMSDYGVTPMKAEYVSLLLPIKCNNCEEKGFALAETNQPSNGPMWLVDVEGAFYLRMQSCWFDNPQIVCEPCQTVYILNRQAAQEPDALYR
jgi:hypothetical protein